LQEEQAALSKAFSDHVLDATNAYFVPGDRMKAS
jgi:hypothetical protein